MMPEKQNTHFQRKTHPLHLSIDVPLLIIVLSLLAIGLLFVYSSSWEFALQQEKEPSYFLKKQISSIAVGIGGGIVAFYFDYHRMQKLVKYMVFGTLILLFLVSIVLGEARLGATRSLWQGSYQPSELAKLVIIIYLAFWVDSKKNNINTISFGLIPLMAIIGLFCGLILLQPDLSTAATIFILGVIMFFLGGADLHQIIRVSSVALIAGLSIVLFHPTGRTRISEYLSGLRNPIEGSYHMIRSIEGIVKGGLFGAGIGMSTVKFTKLPFAPTDSIFAVISEEVGLIGSSILILLFVLLFWRGLRIANHAPDFLGKLLASGISIWIFLEAMINIGVMVNIIPFAGNALPLISYGGSSIATVLTSIGILMGIARLTRLQDDKQEGRISHAVVDLRGNDGWRDIPRSRRSADTKR